MKKIKINKNVFDRTKVDYIHKLTDEEKEWLQRFTNEYYACGHTQKDSMFSKLEDYETKIKQELYLEKNAAERDILSIDYNQTYRMNIDDVAEFLIQTPSESIKTKLTYHTPQSVLNEMISDFSDEIDNFNDDSSTSDKLRFYTVEVVALIIQVLKNEKLLKQSAVIKPRKKRKPTLDN